MGLSGPRAGLRLTTLADGRVLATGGSDSSGAVRTAEVWDPRSERWTRVADMHDARTLHAAALLPDGRVLVVGGATAAPAYWLSSSEVFDPASGTWSALRGLVEPYLSPAAAGLPAGLRAADGTWTGFAARARVLIVNKNKVPAGELPRSIRDLASARWRGQTAIANPLFGTTTMHIAALFAAWGEDDARRFLNDLKAHGVRIASSNGEVKRLVISGEVAFGPRFVEKRGPGLHHVMLRVDDLSLACRAVRRAGFRLAWDEPLDEGFALTQFVHPKDTCDVLVELGQPR